MIWEYYAQTFIADSPRALKNELNCLGGLGWELVTLDFRQGAGFYGVFKRPKQAS